MLSPCVSTSLAIAYRTGSAHCSPFASRTSSPAVLGRHLIDAISSYPVMLPLLFPAPLHACPRLCPFPLFHFSPPPAVIFQTAILSPLVPCLPRYSAVPAILSYSSLPLPAATPCVVVFPRQLPSFPHCLRFRAPCPSPFLTSMSVELPIIRSSRCLGSVAFRTCSTEPCLHSYSVYCFYSMPRLGKLDLCRGHCLAFLTHLLSLFLCVGEL